MNDLERQLINMASLIKALERLPPDALKPGCCHLSKKVGQEIVCARCGETLWVESCRI